MMLNYYSILYTYPLFYGATEDSKGQDIGSRIHLKNYMLFLDL